MGKPTGFLDYERVEATAVSPKERIKNFNEFHTPLSEDEQRKQSSRCMDCGVPFCQPGGRCLGRSVGGREQQGCLRRNALLLHRRHARQRDELPRARGDSQLCDGQNVRQHLCAPDPPSGGSLPGAVPLRADEPHRQPRPLPCAEHPCWTRMSGT